MVRGGARSRQLNRYDYMQKLAISIVLILWCFSSTLAQKPNVAPSIPTVQFCALVRNAADYDVSECLSQQLMVLSRTVTR